MFFSFVFLGKEFLLQVGVGESIVCYHTNTREFFSFLLSFRETSSSYNCVSLGKQLRVDTQDVVFFSFSGKTSSYSWAWRKAWVMFWHTDKRGFPFFSLLLLLNALFYNTKNVHLLCAHQRPERSHDTVNTIFYTHVEHSPTKTIYIQYYTEHTHINTRARARTHTHAVAETWYWY